VPNGGERRCHDRAELAASGAKEAGLFATKRGKIQSVFA
jgi:hypothetical protein